MIKFIFLPLNQIRNHPDKITPHCTAQTTIVEHYNVLSPSSFRSNKRAINVNFTILKEIQHNHLSSQLTSYNNNKGLKTHHKDSFFFLLLTFISHHMIYADYMGCKKINERWWQSTSFSITAMRFPWSAVRIWLSNVVCYT